MAIHVARLGLFTTDSSGNRIDKCCNSVSINELKQTSQDFLVLPDSNLPNTSGYPTIKAYLEAEAVDGYVVKHLDQSIVITEFVYRFHGQASIVVDSTVDVAEAGTYQSTGLVGVLDYEKLGISLGTIDTLALKNTSGRQLLMDVYASADIASGNNHVLGIKLALNGVLIDESECRSPTGTGTGNFAKLITKWMIRMADGDEVALYVTDHTLAGTVTVQRTRLVAIAV